MALTLSLYVADPIVEQVLTAMPSGERSKFVVGVLRDAIGDGDTDDLTAAIRELRVSARKLIATAEQLNQPKEK